MMNNKIIVAGAGTEVGKTIVAAILTMLFEGDYWKPIGSGGEENSDPALMKNLLDPAQHHVHPSAYALQAPFSPHHAARLENISISIDTVVAPETRRPLVIESVGGVFVPLTPTLLSIDLFKKWKAPWVVVSRHYLGSINHTLLTLDALKRHGVAVAGIIFNGEPNPDSEEAILNISKAPCLGRLLPEEHINTQTLQRYAKLWRPQLAQLVL